MLSCSMKMGSCSEGTKNPLLSLTTPQMCDATHDLKKLQDMHSNFKGPFINKCRVNIPKTQIKHEYTKSLSALSSEIPDTLDWRYQGGDSIENGSRNQGQCGCCWAMASVSALGDRYALKNKKQAPYFSAAWAVMCLNQDIPANQQCECGGSNFIAACNFQKKGVKLEKCFPFALISHRNFVSPQCPNFNDDCCYDCCGGNNTDLAKIIVKTTTEPKPIGFWNNENSKNNLDPATTIRAIQKDIYQFGPIVTSFLVPSDWSDWFSSKRFKGGEKIWQPSDVKNKTMDGHAVVLVGWGRDKDDKLYWIVRNSWGLLHGKDSGFCYMYASYDPKHSNPQILKELWTGLDIPVLISDNQIAGGCISFQVGTEHSDWKGFKPGNGPGSLTPNVPKAPNYKINFQHIQWILLASILIIFLIILIGAKIFHKKT